MPYANPELRRKRDRDRSRRRTAERIAQGLCPRCGKQPPAPGLSACRQCGKKTPARGPRPGRQTPSRRLAWEGLLRRGNRSGADARPTTPLPPVIPFVVYNGSSPWTAPLDVSELIAPVASVLSRLQPANRYVLLDMQRSWDDDYGVLTRDDEALRDELVRMAAAGEVEAMGSLAVERWKELERRKEAQILARGMAQGRTEGLEFERRLLGSQAARRFGADTGQRLSALLADVAEPERMAAMGYAIIECGTGAELLAAARRIVGAAN